jgi:hypothetical protein
VIITKQDSLKSLSDSLAKQQSTIINLQKKNQLDNAKMTVTKQVCIIQNQIGRLQSANSIFEKSANLIDIQSQNRAKQIEMLKEITRDGNKLMIVSSTYESDPQDTSGCYTNLANQMK